MRLTAIFSSPRLTAFVFCALCVLVTGMETYRYVRSASHLYRDHQEVRSFIIRAALNGASHPIIVYGDSITEMARLPQTICGLPVINAGIGAATISDLARLAPVLFHDVAPKMFFLPLGANDGWSLNTERSTMQLLSTLKGLTTAIIVTSDTRNGDLTRQLRDAANRSGASFILLPIHSFMDDGIHPSHAGYQDWIPRLSAAITNECRTVIASPSH